VGAAVEQVDLLAFLQGRPALLQALELSGPAGQTDTRKAKKLGEVAGLCEVALRYARRFLAGRDVVRIVEFSCGKSYLGIVLSLLLRELDGRRTELVGVDSNAVLIEKCRSLARSVGLDDAEFVPGRSLRFESERSFDMAVALHACDTATDEAIAKGIQLGVPLILAVPCCQNQIRGQIKAGHLLTAMTEFGPVRYRLANMLTDVLRAQFLRCAGYYVEMTEIASPRLTPKNLCICARKTKRGGGERRCEGYRTLRSFFNVRPKLEAFCPGVVPEG
jgi:hypothetical protein